LFRRIHIPDIGGVIDASLTWDSCPMQTFPLPLMSRPAKRPKAVLLSPVMLKRSALTPTAVLSLPSVVLERAPTPEAVFRSPLVFR